MTYEVGTYIDLKSGRTYPPGVARVEPEPDAHLLPVGTRILFKYMDGICKQVIKIPVAYAT